MFGITDRRHFLQHSIASAGLTLPGLEFLAKVRAAAPEMRKKQKSLIILWMAGGPPTIDMFDMKPGSPNGGPHKPINTVVSGIQISEYLPKLAKVFNHLSIIRSLNSREGDHDRGTYIMNTGRQRNPLLDYPSIGSVLATIRRWILRRCGTPICPLSFPLADREAALAFWACATLRSTYRIRVSRRRM